VRRTRFDDWDCSVARTTDILGDWWTPMVLRSAFLGARRFEEFADALGIPRNVLTERLNRLVDEGIMERQPYQERPVRYSYRLTEKGVALWPVIVTMLEWGNQWLSWPADVPPVHLVDRESGEVLEPMLVDRRTGVAMDPRKTRARYGPGRGSRPSADDSRAGTRPAPPSGDDEGGS
jgi:DNA-binding HxlR family transcriptional regulator